METIRIQKETKARKEHRCSFCSYRIMKGEKYMKSTHVYDGDIYDWKAHKYCDKLACDLNMYDELYSEGLTSDDFMTHVMEKHDDMMRDILPKGDDYNDIIKQLYHVGFFHQMMYVIRNLKK